MERAFEVKWKTFFLVPQVLSFKPKKQTSENVADTTFKGCVLYFFGRLFLGQNESTCQIKKNIFYITSKALFFLKKIKFQSCRFSNFMTSSDAEA